MPEQKANLEATAELSKFILGLSKKEWAEYRRRMIELGTTLGEAIQAMDTAMGED